MIGTVFAQKPGKNAVRSDPSPLLIRYRVYRVHFDCAFDAAHNEGH